jgi:hypothetical protein
MTCRLFNAIADMYIPSSLHHRHPQMHCDLTMTSFQPNTGVWCGERGWSGCAGRRWPSGDSTCPMGLKWGGRTCARPTRASTGPSSTWPCSSTNLNHPSWLKQWSLILCR